MRAISRPWAAPIEHDRGHREDHSLRREFALGQDLVGQAADENPSWRSKFTMQDHAKSKIELFVTMPIDGAQPTPVWNEATRRTSAGASCQTEASRYARSTRLMRVW
jgi:hypothetical protein